MNILRGTLFKTFISRFKRGFLGLHDYCVGKDIYIFWGPICGIFPFSDILRFPGVWNTLFVRDVFFKPGEKKNLFVTHFVGGKKNWGKGFKKFLGTFLC